PPFASSRWKSELGDTLNVMRPLRYSINVTFDGCCDHREMIADEDLHRNALENIGQGADVVRGAIEAYRLEAREPAGVRLRGGGDAV
ncbi:MAG: hypothetical protein M3037_05330, partial [Gemmatimonadota bacterium]|nr:hypothetical protein [Gemmatimonadota bacterium]